MIIKKMWMNFQLSFKSLNRYYYLDQYAAEDSTYLTTT